MTCFFPLPPPQGAFGSVFRGVCNFTRRAEGGEREEVAEVVAVKLMPLQIETAEPLRREIRMLRECNHENIVAYRDAFMREYAMRSMLWVIMEFCDGGSALASLRERESALQAQPLSAEEVLERVESAVHARSRNISPATCIAQCSVCAGLAPFSQPLRIGYSAIAQYAEK